MAFPALVLRTDPNSPGGVSELWAEATGIADVGLNTFLIPFINTPPAGAGLDPAIIDEDWFEVHVYPLGAGMTNAFPGVPLISMDRQFMTIDFVTDGLTSARVVARLYHTVVR